MQRLLVPWLLWEWAAPAARVGGSSLPLRGDSLPSRTSLDFKECSDEERSARSNVRFVFPKNHQKLDSIVDLALGRNLLVRMRTERFKLGVDGCVMVLLMGVDVADVQGNRGSHDFKTVYIVCKANIELFGLTEGHYKLTAVLVDRDETGRECWANADVSFTILVREATNRSEALLGGLRSLSQKGGRMAGASRSSWLPQPRTHSDFGYVTAIWGDAYIDNVIAWAASLIAVGSTFTRFCMVIEELISQTHLEMLRRCCCELLPVEPVHSPWEATRGQWSRYELVLTKLRVFQLGRFGLKKLVLMDADMLVLQNIDELFWNPAPASTLLPGSLFGATGPKMSAGLLVIEPSETEFEALMARLRLWTSSASDGDTMLFIEQDLMDLHYQSKDGRLLYHVLPFTYNLNPDMLDTLPFLVPANASAPDRFPLDYGVKVLHLWNWFNPILGVAHSARQALQLHARMKHKQLWKWYELWWDMHQIGLSRAVPEKYPIWKEECVSQNVQRYGSLHASKFVPAFAGGAMQCMHIYGGLAW